MHVAGCWLQREQTQLLLVDCQVSELPTVNRINISLSVPALEQLWSFMYLFHGKPKSSASLRTK